MVCLSVCMRLCIPMSADMSVYQHVDSNLFMRVMRVLSCAFFPNPYSSTFTQTSSILLSRSFQKKTCVHCAARPLTADATACVTWGKNHFRTFDNRVYDFRGSCQYLLARDCLYQTFDIYVINEEGCVDNGLSRTNSSTCKRDVDVYLAPTTRIQLQTSSELAVLHVFLPFPLLARYFLSLKKEKGDKMRLVNVM